MLEWGSKEIICIVALVLLVIYVLVTLFKKDNVQINQTVNCPPQKEIIKEIHYEKVTLPILLKIIIPVTVVSVSLTLFSFEFNLECPKCRKPIPPAPKIYFYDTDPGNNAFIIQNLDPSHLENFDKLLMFEKKLCGERLSKSNIKKYSTGDNVIEDAYSRWRKCKDLRRSSGSTVYPDEREYFNKLYNLNN